MAAPIEALFQQNAWATARLIEFCQALSSEQLDAPAPATAGTVRKTLAHIVEAEQIYITRLGGRAPGPILAPDDDVSLDVLLPLVRQTGEVLASMATGAASDWRVKGVTEYGLPFDTEGIVFLLQAINHASGHRQQVVSLLSGLGWAPADLDEQIDAWSWGVATGKLKVGEAK